LKSVLGSFKVIEKLQNGEKTLRILVCLLISIHEHNGQTDRRTNTPYHGIGRAMHRSSGKM